MRTEVVHVSTGVRAARNQKSVLHWLQVYSAVRYGPNIEAKISLKLAVGSNVAGNKERMTAHKVRSTDPQLCMLTSYSYALTCAQGLRSSLHPDTPNEAFNMTG